MFQGLREVGAKHFASAPPSDGAQPDMELLVAGRLLGWLVGWLVAGKLGFQPSKVSILIETSSQNDSTDLSRVIKLDFGQGFGPMA